MNILALDFFLIVLTIAFILSVLIIIDLMILRNKYRKQLKINNELEEEYRRGTIELNQLKKDIQVIKDNGIMLNNNLKIYSERADLLNRENVKLRERSEEYRERLINLGIKID